MPKLSRTFCIDCPLPADVVRVALSDFSAKRFEYFPNLSRATFEVFELNDSTALVREGAGPFYSRLRYNWSAEGRIWSVVTESNVLAAGSLTDVRIEPRDRRSCRVSIHIENEYIGRVGSTLYAFIMLNGRTRFFRRLYLRTLKNVRRSRQRR